MAPALEPRATPWFLTAATPSAAWPATRKRSREPSLAACCHSSRTVISGSGVSVGAWASRTWPASTSPGRPRCTVSWGWRTGSAKLKPTGEAHKRSRPARSFPDTHTLACRSKPSRCACRGPRDITASITRASPSRRARAPRAGPAPLVPAPTPRRSLPARGTPRRADPPARRVVARLQAVAHQQPPHAVANRRQRRRHLGVARPQRRMKRQRARGASVNTSSSTRV